jgi:hypothetical protein
MTTAAVEQPAPVARLAQAALVAQEAEEALLELH